VAAKSSIELSGRLFFSISPSRLFRSVIALSTVLIWVLLISACSESDGMSSEAVGLVFGPPAAEVESSPWIPYVDNDAKAEFSVIEGGRDTSGSALRVTVGDKVGTDRWNIQVFQPSIAVETDVVYEYKVWVNGEPGMLVTVAVESDSYDTIGSKEIYLVGEWQPIAFEFISTYPEIRAPIHFGYPQNLGKSLIVGSVSLSIAD